MLIPKPCVPSYFSWKFLFYRRLFFGCVHKLSEEYLFQTPRSFYDMRCRRHILTGATCQSKQSAEISYSLPNDKKGQKSEECTDNGTAVIVKLLRQNCDNKGPNESKVQKLSIDYLQKKLEEIKWDTEARIFRENIEELEQTNEEISELLEEKETSRDYVSSETFIEDVYLDDDVPQVKTISLRKRKQKVKGTPDPSIPAGDIPCSGCGAMLHCQDPIIPGYLPSEKFKCLTREEMHTSLCQRCFLIQTYNMFLNVKVSADTYPQILCEIKDTRALVIVVVDLFDMKNSVFKDLLKYIGINRPLFVVGNKVDMIPKDSPGYLERTKQALWDVCEAAHLNPTGKNIQHLCLVSAKTGYGIESLVSKLMTVWKLKGHIYVVGSTNVGKSTLFNALLMSDYCKAVARGFINRATVSVWPGTTLNLLKFPIINPAPWRLLLRVKRLVNDEKKYAEEEFLRRSQLNAFGSYKAAVLTGHIGLTDFRSAKKIAEDEAEAEEFTSGQDILSFRQDEDGFIQEISGRDSLSKGLPSHGYKPESYKMYWCNDTPGVVNPEQIINLLEPQELVFILPRSLVQPQCVVVKPGQVLFITGMGRIDFIQNCVKAFDCDTKSFGCIGHQNLSHDLGDQSIYLTAHVAHTVKLHVKDGDKADDFYLDSLGSTTLGVPFGNDERLSKIPALVGREFQITGLDWNTASADIQLSSLGWVSVAASHGRMITLRAYTPGGRGLHLRSPSLLPNIARFRGQRKGKTPYFQIKTPKM